MIKTRLFHVGDSAPSSHWIGKNHMLSIPITDLWRKQLLTSCIGTSRRTASYHFFRALSQSSWLLATLLCLYRWRSIRLRQHMQLWLFTCHRTSPSFLIWNRSPKRINLKPCESLSLGNRSSRSFSPAPVCCSLSLYISYHTTGAKSIVFFIFFWVFRTVLTIVRENDILLFKNK